MNPFRVHNFFITALPGLSLRSNPGLKLAKDFGVFPGPMSVFSGEFHANSGSSHDGGKPLSRLGTTADVYSLGQPRDSRRVEKLVQRNLHLQAVSYWRDDPCGG